MVIREDRDPLNLIIYRHVAVEPVTQLFIKRTVKINRVRIGPVQHLIQVLIRRQRIADRNPALEKIMNILARPLQGNLQVLLFP
ncbi:hypothetical protein D3C73_984890 [compost metagenome]